MGLVATAFWKGERQDISSELPGQCFAVQMLSVMLANHCPASACRCTLTLTFIVTSWAPSRGAASCSLNMLERA